MGTGAEKVKLSMKMGPGLEGRKAAQSERPGRCQSLPLLKFAGDPGQVTPTFWASVSSSVKWGEPLLGSQGGCGNVANMFREAMAIPKVLILCSSKGRGNSGLISLPLPLKINISISLVAQ